MNDPILEKHCWAEIDLDALRHNFAFIKRTIGGPVCAVVKADAYGHGDIVVARVLQEEGAAAFAVSCLAEAKRLRRHGITVPVLILGYADPSEASALAQEDIATACFSTEYAKALSAAAVAAGVQVKVHLKIDTGMGRIGFAAQSDWQAVVRELEALCSLPGLSICGIFQHFAVADSLEPDAQTYTDNQYTLFRKVVDQLQADGYDTGTVHCANSAAQLRHPEWRNDMTRAGIILYGLDPSDELHFPVLKPVMTLKCIVTFVKDLLPGQSVSYGRTFTAKAPMRVATACVGYADGYPRMLSGSQGQGLMMVNGRPAPVLGRVCMDQTLLDVTNIPGVRMGDEVTVFGPGAPDTADTIARKTDTISYEIVCGIARRVPRVYMENGKICKIWNDLEEN
ncbi:alanine racemase [Subdoligranulum variabile]|uniref:Alanine racemase n=1 Tax=Subdoligranulum variabile DSM 15176 TaxID=411471 RepID=D1PN64_9FIRM|nr:alanine racemase [Subdoligranulum variabile]EFB75999.1 alanine racemase [Subdoligranulum variabile DSM 15176]UWP68654.1 alanine racemase [Subdoligranulum variabile]